MFDKIQTLLLLATFTAAQQVDLDKKCYFSLGKNSLTCEDLVDNFNPDNLKTIFTDETHMFTIRNSGDLKFTSHRYNCTQDDCHHFKDIVTYNILDNNNHSVVLEPYSFHGLSNIHYMKISGNVGLKAIEDSTFYGLAKMEILNLEKNGIEQIAKRAFRGLHRLITLDLSHNQIRELHDDTFTDLNELTALLLEHNNITTIAPLAFSGLNNLETFDLSTNSLKVLDCSVFNHNTPKLQNLYLGRNEIGEIRGEFAMENLQFLQLENNKIGEIKNGTFEGLSVIMSIDLSANALGGLSEGPFLHLESLRRLNLQKNGLKIDDFQTVKQVALVTV